MAQNETLQLQPMHIDVLTEVGNIGSGNAATALASMMSTVVDIEVPVTTLVDYSEIAKLLGGGDTPAIGISLDIAGRLNGMILHILHPDFTRKLINTFYPTNIASLDDLTEMDMSVVSEMGNITSGAYVTALAEMTNLFINISPPRSQRGTIASILLNSEAAMPKLGNQVLFIDVKLKAAESEINSNLLLMLDEESLKTLFDHLKVSY